MIKITGFEFEKAELKIKNAEFKKKVAKLKEKQLQNVIIKNFLHMSQVS